MTAILATLGAAIVLVAALAGASRLLARQYALSTPADELHHAPTTDGFRIALYRYRPRDGVAGREPVLLCHGLLSNHFSMDFDEEVSLARFLRRAGFDVWVMDLRGRGESRRARPKGPALPFDWSMDEFIREDLPAAVRSVLAETGTRSLHWVGHSLGGMILYAHSAAGDTSWFRSAVTIDSPGHLAPVRMITWPARVYARLVPIVPVILFKPLTAALYLTLPGVLFRRLVLLDTSTLLRILYNGLVDVGSSRVLLHLARCLAEGRFRSFDGRVDYEEGPRRIRFPLMVLRAVAGRSPEACVRHAYETSPAPDKIYVRCGRADGFSIDHNHFSLVLGRSAPAEIFPRIAEWLRSHSSA